MRPLEAVLAELDQVTILLAKTPAIDSVTVSDLRQRHRELTAEVAESRRRPVTKRVAAHT